MFRFRNALPFLVAAFIGVMGFGAPAQGAFTISLQETGVNGGAVTQVASGADFTSASYGSGAGSVYGDFLVKVLSSSSDNDPVTSDLLSSTNTIKNQSGSTKTLTIYVSQTHYTLPSTPKLNVESSMGGSGANGLSTLVGIFQAYADKNDTLNGTSDFTNGPQNGVANGNSYDTGSKTGVFSRTGAYSLTTKVTLTIKAGQTVNFSNSENVTATPAPAGIALLLSAVPALGIGGWLRRRRVQA